MNFYNSIFLVSLFLMTSCSEKEETNFKFSKKETALFLKEITKNIKPYIGDIAKIEKKPTNYLYLTTRHPLSQAKLEEYEKNDVIINRNDDISDFATYTFKNYILVNENNDTLQFVDNGRSVYLQKYALWEYDNVMCINLGIEIELDKKYSTLKGHVLMEFEMPRGLKQEVKIPVNISIYDKATE